MVIDHLADEPAALQLLNRLALDGLTISMITSLEVYQGVLVSPDPLRAEVRLNAFLAAVPIVPFSLAVARRCAQLRTDLKQQGKRVRSRALDLLAAATALEHDLILVTRNVADFEDIPGMQLHSAE